jgi:histidyl-tRNA synthetase
MSKYQRVPGTHDLYPGASDWEDDSERTIALEDTFRSLCSLYGFSEIRTPIFEDTELFTRSIGDGTDIVSKEMYTFNDRGGDSLTLRPEGTAPALRAYLESGMLSRPGVAKLYYIASIFRAEHPQKGRYRQHEQLGVEALGADDPALDAEIIGLAYGFLRRIGIRSLTLKLNSVGSMESRAAYVQALKEFVSPHLDEFGADGKARFAKNPLRMLDTKNERELAILADAPLLTDYLSDEEAEQFATLRGYLDALGIVYDVDPHLVRGFDYYTKTAFEIQSPDIGAQSALAGGGRYNKLIEELGGQPTPGIGFGLGIERALIALKELGVDPLPSKPPTVQVVCLGDTARLAGVTLLADLRAGGIPANTEYGARSMKAQMRAANSSGARLALILGDDEVAQGIVQLKDLSDGTQRAVGRDEIVREVKEQIG